jgi:hypothetical protein
MNPATLEREKIRMPTPRSQKIESQKSEWVKLFWLLFSVFLALGPLPLVLLCSARPVMTVLG